jgi:hypothetical protein
MRTVICEGREAKGCAAPQRYKTGINVWSETDRRGPEVHVVARNCKLLFLRWADKKLLHFSISPRMLDAKQYSRINYVAKKLRAG